MSECYRYLFLHNEKLKSTELFKDSYLQSGLSLYEVVRVVSGKAIFLTEHYSRLCNSAKKIETEIWYSFEQIKSAIQSLITKNDITEGNIKLIFNIKKESRNFYAYFVKHSYPTKSQYENGVRTFIHQAERPTPTAKIYNHKLRSKTNNIIKEANIFEVILLNSLGYVTEGSKSNLFFIKKNTIYTAPDNEVLHGIVRGKVIQIAQKLGIPIVKTSISYDDLPTYDACFLSGTSPMILPINRINSLSFSCNHLVLKQILLEYQQLVQANLNQ